MLLSIAGLVCDTHRNTNKPRSTVLENGVTWNRGVTWNKQRRSNSRCHYSTIFKRCQKILLVYFILLFILTCKKQYLHKISQALNTILIGISIKFKSGTIYCLNLPKKIRSILILNHCPLPLPFHVSMSIKFTKGIIF